MLEVRRWADDLEKAIITPPGSVLYRAGVPVRPPLPVFGLMLHFLDGRRTAVYGNDVALVLNDGIPSRMGVRVESGP